MIKEVMSNEMEPFYWVQIYDDNTVLEQYEKEQNEDKYILHSFYEIDQSKLKFFVIRRKDSSSDFSIFQLDFIPQKMKLIWYWDREITLTGNSLVKTTHCFGWQETIGDKTIKVIVHLNPYTNVVRLERS